MSLTLLPPFGTHFFYWVAMSSISDGGDGEVPSLAVALCAMAH